VAFIQKLFTTLQKYPDGNTRIGEKNRIWYDSNTNTLRIQLDASPGGTIISGGGGLVLQAISVNTVAASNGGTLTYSNGVFTYAPANLSSLATTTYVNNQIDAVKDRIVSPNNQHITNIDNTGTTTFGGDIIPGAATYNLGSVSQPWKDVYVSKGSIVIADNDINVDGVSISNTDKYLVIDRGGLKVTSLNVPDREVFRLDGTGKLLLKSEIPLTADSAAFEVIGSLLGESLPIVNRGVMIHSSGAVNIPSRVYVDGVGTQLTSPFDSAYPAFIGRYARGTVAIPQPAQSGDIIVRFGGNALANTLGLNTISNVRIDMTATETQSAEGRGSRIELWTTPNGSLVPQRSLHIDSQGIDLSESTDINSGVTFKNGSLLKYWPSVTGNTGKILRTNGTDFFWDTETVPEGQVLFKGDWSAANPPGGGTPTISDSTGTVGWQYIVSEAGTQNLGHGSVAYTVGDQLIHDGTKYVRIPAQTAQVQADWTETNSALPAYIKHKPTLSTVATTGSYNDLLNRPSIPAAQLPSDWNSVTSPTQILNKPAIPTQYTDTLARAAISLTSNTPSGSTSTLTYTSGAFVFTSAAALVSGTTIKTVNSNSLLGSGDVSVGTVTSVSGTGSVSGLTLSGSVSVSGSLTLGGTLSGITNTNLSGTAGITNANLANSTISGVSLGGSLFNLTAGVGITFSSGTTYNGSAAITVNNSITQYTDALARAAISVSGNLSYNSSSGVISYTTPTYTVSTAAASGVGALSLSGTTFTFTPAVSYTLPIATASVLGGVKVDGTSITINSGVISAVSQGIDDFSSTVTTQASTLTVDFTGSSVIFWQPSATGNRTVTLSGFTAGRRVKIFITPKAGANTFTFTGVTASQCSNGSITFVLGGGGVSQSSMMIELFSTTTAIGGVWIFGFGSQ
jgi:hypothetical protein